MDTLNIKSQKNVEKLMENIIKRDECWTIDLFPKRIENMGKLEEVEEYLLKNRIRKKYNVNHRNMKNYINSIIYYINDKVQ